MPRKSAALSVAEPVDVDQQHDVSPLQRQRLECRDDPFVDRAEQDVLLSAPATVRTVGGM